MGIGIYVPRWRQVAMAAEHIEEICEQHIKPLSAADQLRFVELIACGLAATLNRDAPHSRSLLEREGLGREIWQGIDPQAYVDELRGEWDQHP